MFEGFTTSRIEVNGVDLHVVHGGGGPAVLLLHGYPQTHVMWHKVAPDLARTCTVIAPDMRGYGDSDKPKAAPGDHFLPEERPGDVVSALLDFYADIDGAGQMPSG